MAATVGPGNFEEFLGEYETLANPHRDLTRALSKRVDKVAEGVKLALKESGVRFCKEQQGSVLCFAYQSDCTEAWVQKSR